MSKKITGAEYPLMKIFSSDFAYFIPSYQRPYAWTEEEAGILFDDLYDFYKTVVDDNYFLGSIVLIKEEDKPRSDVIDGQQRLTTLTILLAALTSYFDGDLRNDYLDYLKEPGRISQGIPYRPRLCLRLKDQPFFEKYIQNVQLDELTNINPTILPNEAQRHIQTNCKILLEKIDKAFKSVDEIKAFGSFLVQRCFIVAVYTPSQQSAFRVFSVMNSRGLDLLPTDIIKADIMGNILPEKQQEIYTDKWENLEVQTSRTGFNDLFGHVRMIFVKAKAKRTVLEEFREFVLPTVSSGEELIDNVLTPYADSYCEIKDSHYNSNKNVSEVNDYLLWLNRIDNSDWMPSAILFLAQQRNEPDYVLWFFKKLERLAAYLNITSKDINKRIERYSKILSEIEAGTHSMQAPLKIVELTDGEKKEFLETLDGNIYGLTARRRNYVILRLDSFVSCGGASYDSRILTIEHVLPQTVDPKSNWAKLWPNEDDRNIWLNKIANLVPLTRRHNSQAQNYDFDVKKTSYFTGKNGTTSYALTTQVLGESIWGESEVAARQHNLLNEFKNNWEL